MNPDILRQVKRRVNDRGEYCHLPAAVFPLPFHVDHIIARQHGGLTILENLAFACLHCNRHKGPNIAGTDPSTGELVRLFDPRKDQWAAHFDWTEGVLVGRTAVGRTTIQVLSINDPDFLAVREALLREQVFPVE